jgi:gliding motility-associated-like protein
MSPKLLQQPLLLFIALCITHIVPAQKQWSSWFFNGKTKMDFNTPSGKGELKTLFLPQSSSFTNYYNWSGTGTAYCDPATGAMKFMVSNGVTFDRNYEMLNTPYLRMCSGDAYSLHIVPFANNPSKFYVIQFQSRAADMLAASSGLQVRCPNGVGLAYSVFDLSLNGGLGNYVSMNKVVTAGLPERISVVKHANGKDTWVIVHGWNNNTFSAYLFTDAGVQPPVHTSIGPTISGEFLDALGNMVPSHNGKMLAAQQGERNFVELYDFNNSTGVLSNYRTIPNVGTVDHLLFSPDDSKLYALGAYQNPGLFQYDLLAPNVAGSRFRIAHDPSKTYWQMQLGPDGRIYVSSVQSQSGDWFSVINCPNLPEYAANFEPRAFQALSYGLFPQFVNDYVQQPQAAPVTKFSLGKDTAICFGSHTLSAPEGWDSYKWNTGETTRQISVTEPGTYYVLTGELGFSCPSGYGGITLANAAKPLSLGKDTILCPGGNYTLSVPQNFFNPLWSNGSTSTTNYITTSGIRSLIAEDENGCKNWDTVYVGFNFYPRAVFGADTTICNNGTMLLRMEPVSFFTSQSPVYQWNDGSTKDTLRVKAPGTYWGTITYQGCTVSDTINVRYLSAQGVSLGKDTTLCKGDSLQLAVNIQGIGVEWSTGARTPSIQIKNSGTYWVKVNNGTCTVSDTINVTFVQPPIVTLPQDTTLCEGESLLLYTSNGVANYLWSNGSTTGTLLVKATGEYWVQVKNEGCARRDTILVNFKLKPTLRLGSDTTLCMGSSFLLNAAHPSIASYRWQDGTTQPTMTVRSGGTYWLQATGTNNCTARDTIVVAVQPVPAFSLPPDTAICEGTTLALNASEVGNTYLWNTGSTANNLRVSSPGLYWVEGSRGGCKRRDSIVVTTKPYPVVNLGADTVLCEGATLSLWAGSGGSFNWSDGTPNASLLVTKPGTYRVAVNLAGCVSYDTVKVDYRYKPVFTLGRDTILCSGTTIELRPTSQGASMLWQDGSTGTSFTVSTPGLYKLTMTNDCGSSWDEKIVEGTVCGLFVPTAFTPNRDGKNDLFRVGFPGSIKTFRLTVYNRWGGVVFQTTDPQKGWDGTYKGVPQPADAYAWVVSLTNVDGRAESEKGMVVIIR